MNSKENRGFALIENYIYLYHTNTFMVLPVYPDQIQDQNQATFNSTTPIARSAPIYSYSGSGPRSVGFSFTLHRDLMSQVNYGVSNVKVEIDDDYVDTLIKQIQSMALPNYNAVGKMVDPPMVAVRIGDDIFIKGVVVGGPIVNYSGALITNPKNPSGLPRYSIVSISFSVYEIDPYSAETVAQMGSFRGLTSTLEDRLYGRSVMNNTVK